jgi:monoamine oxidase
VLTGAYNRGDGAKEFGSFDQKKRIATALAGGAKLHPGFEQKVYADRGVTIAWHYMPFQVGGWASDTANTQPDVYKAITDLPQGRLYLVGDAYSYLPGWQEGAVTSVHAAISRHWQNIMDDGRRSRRDVARPRPMGRHLRAQYRRHSLA